MSSQPIIRTLPTRASPGATEGQFTVVVSNGQVDRMNDRIDPKGWHLDEYRANPIVLWQHNRDVPAVAKCLSIGVKGTNLVAVVEFPPPSTRYALAHAIHDLVAGGYLNASSVGFRPLQSRPNDLGGFDFVEQSLDEFSFCNLPALPSALVQRVDKGLDRVSVAGWLKAGRVLSAANLQRVNDAIAACSESDVSMMLARHHLKSTLEHCRTLRESAGPTDEGDETDAVGIEDDDDAHTKSVLDVDDDDDIDPMALALAVKDVLSEVRDAVTAARSEARRRAGFGVDALTDPRARHDSLNDLIAREVQSAVNRARGRVD